MLLSRYLQIWSYGQIIVNMQVLWQQGAKESFTIAFGLLLILYQSNIFKICPV